MKRHVVLPPLLLNIPAIANKSPTDVARVLGPADGRVATTGPDASACTYRQGKIEVVFASGRAVRIVLREAGSLAFEPSSLSKLGLPVKKPTYARGRVLRWDNYCGMREVSLFPAAGGRVSHVCVYVGASHAA